MSDESRSEVEEGKPAPMSILDHIAELRSTLIWAFGLAFLAAIGAWFFSDSIVDTLLRPAHEAGQETLYFQAPMEAFLLKLKASAVVGLLLVFPLILFKIYGFVLPGLLPKEKRVVTPLLVGATLLFYVGVAFCFLILLPLVIRFAMGFATDSLQPWLTAGAYFDLASRLCLAFGILFELPMVVFALSWVGLVDPKVLLKGWRYAFVLILIVSATLTPPDVISQVLLGGPVMVLYIGSVLLSMIVRRRQRKSKAERRAAEDAEMERIESEYRAAQAAAAAPKDSTGGAGDAVPSDSELDLSTPPDSRPRGGPQAGAGPSERDPLPRGGSADDDPGERPNASDEGDSRGDPTDPGESN